GDQGGRHPALPAADHAPHRRLVAGAGWSAAVRRAGPARARGLRHDPAVRASGPGCARQGAGVVGAASWRTSGARSKRGPLLVMGNSPLTWVGVAGFEPAASSSRTKRAAKLRHTPPPETARTPGRLCPGTPGSLTDTGNQREQGRLRPAGE